MKKLLLLPLLICSLSCRVPVKNSRSESRHLPEVQFALAQIGESLTGSSVRLDTQNIHFILDSVRLGEQEYTIETARNLVTITGGDRRGMLYGGLETAEQIQLNNRVAVSSGSPFIKQRGLKFNIPLDARTPSYDDSGDAAQKNITEVWSWDFWEEFLDNMALHRYNVLSLWNPHPFPSMIKLEEYPEVALDDVYRTTLEPEGYENEWGDPGLVTENVMDNLEMVLEIGIDDKIEFWKKVMRHAKNRGIDIYWINWNICPNSVATPVEPYYKTYEINLEKHVPGKHGITYEMDNPVTIDYFRKAVKTFLLTYPDIEGIGVTAGEHMPLEWKGYNREKWLWETYGMGILDAREVQPERRVNFIHRVWHSDMQQIMKYWDEYPDPFEVSFKYAKARLYSSPDLPFALSHIDEMEHHGLKSWWNLRNDDIFVYRWGDPEYVREFLGNLPAGKFTAGYYMGSDGYVWGREFISKVPELSGQLEIEKHWYSFLLWGRLGYDNLLSREFFINKLECKYGIPDGNLLYDTWQTVSKVIPLVNIYHWRDWDHHWSVESCQARPKLGGFRDVFDFIDNPTLENSNIMNPRDFVMQETSDKSITEFTPLEVRDSIRHYAHTALDGLAAIGTENSSPEYTALVDDIRAQASLGLYYASKISAAVHLARYQELKDPDEKELAINELKDAYQHWESYAEISSRNYHTQMLARTNMLDWDEISLDILAEIELVRNH